MGGGLGFTYLVECRLSTSELDPAHFPVRPQPNMTGSMKPQPRPQLTHSLRRDPCSLEIGESMLGLDKAWVQIQNPGILSVALIWQGIRSDTPRQGCP